jgi:hypothetical protein
MSQSRTIALGENAQAVFGPLHRHVAQIQEAFRDPNAPRGTPAYRLTLDAQGDKLVINEGVGASEADFVRAQRIVDAHSLIRLRARVVSAKAKCSLRSHFLKVRATLRWRR